MVGIFLCNLANTRKINMFKDIKNRLAKLEREVFASKEEEDNWTSIVDRAIFRSFCGEAGDKLVDKVDRQNKQLSKLQARFDLLLKHFKLEYHKITDENGSTTVSEGYKKAKKKKIKVPEKFYDED
jgi:hypothetical protein